MLKEMSTSAWRRIEADVVLACGRLLPCDCYCNVSNNTVNIIRLHFASVGSRCDSGIATAEVVKDHSDKA